MTFSVIIPTFNRVHFIARAIDSVLQQSYSNFEILVIDDGSTDGTGEIIKSKYGNKENVIYLYKINEERGAARNFGIRHSKGDYAVFLDSDDLMKPNYLDILSKIIYKHEPLFLATKYIFRNEKGHEWPSSMVNIREGWYGRELFLKGNMLACNYCIRLNNPGLQFFPEDRELASMEDWLFLLLNINGFKIYIGEEKGVVMMEHSGRSMADNKKIINARNKATEWAIQHISFSVKEIRILKAYSHYFCGIHEYLDGGKRSAIKQSVAAIRSGGIKAKFLFLFLKSIIGKKFIERLKHHER